MQAILTVMYQFIVFNLHEKYFIFLYADYTICYYMYHHFTNYIVCDVMHNKCYNIAANTVYNRLKVLHIGIDQFIDTYWMECQ